MTMEIVLLLAGGALSLVSSRTARWWRRRRRRTTRRRAFGGVAAADEIVIELARWLTPPASRRETRLRIRFPDGERAFYGPDVVAAATDVEVSAAVTAAVVDAFAAPPRIGTVGDVATSDDETRICVGSPVVNPHVAEILARAGTRFPWDFAEHTEDEESGSSMHLVRDDGVTSERFDATATHDLAVVMRALRPSGAYDFVVAGIHAAGTLAGGAWLRDHWGRFDGAAEVAGVVLRASRLHPTRDIEEVEVVGLG